MQDNAVFVAELSHLPKIMDWVRGHIVFSECDAQTANKIEVSLEEIFVNIISYAYQDQAGSIEVLADIQPSQQLVFTIKDRGSPFNPIDHQALTELPIEERSPGGLGIIFVKHFMDAMDYRRDGNYNVLTLKKSCN